MSHWQDNCVPCIYCGVKPIVIDVAYGRNHSDLMCQCCGRRTDTDGKLKWAIKDWNDMNGWVVWTDNQNKDASK